MATGIKIQKRDEINTSSVYVLKWWYIMCITIFYGGKYYEILIKHVSGYGTGNNGWVQQEVYVDGVSGGASE